MTRILDAACGSKMFWFNKDNALATFGDIRKETHILCDGRTLNISPDLQMDFAAIPFSGNLFDYVVFDPPHLAIGGDNGWQVKKYGRLPNGWRKLLATGFTECFRVLKNGGALVFKWNETQIRVSDILSLANAEPLFGHKSGKQQNTHWLFFVKQVPTC